MGYCILGQELTENNLISIENREFGHRSQHHVAVLVQQISHFFGFKLNQTEAKLGFTCLGKTG
jgi:hypothetical protein